MDNSNPQKSPVKLQSNCNFDYKTTYKMVGYYFVLSFSRSPLAFSAKKSAGTRTIQKSNRQLTNSRN